jgi:hypothetical protein
LLKYGLWQANYEMQQSSTISKNPIEASENPYQVHSFARKCVIFHH